MTALYLFYFKSMAKVKFLKSGSNLKVNVVKTTYLTEDSHMQIATINNSSGSKVIAKEKVSEK